MLNNNAPVSNDQARVAKKAFKATFWADPSTRDTPVNGVGISVVRLAKTRRNDHPLHSGLRAVEDPNACLSVTLDSEPADWAIYPTMIDSVRVFYQVVEDIVAL